MIHSARTLSVGIERPLAEVAAFLAEPHNFPSWASGLAGGLRPTEAPTEWRGDTPGGAVTIRFSPPNAYGVADHWVRLADGSEVYVPLRVFANGDGCEVALTLFRLPAMDDARFEGDSDWARRDLDSLKRLLESGAFGARQEHAGAA